MARYNGLYVGASSGGGLQDAEAVSMGDSGGEELSEEERNALLSEQVTACAVSKFQVTCGWNRLIFAIVEGPLAEKPTIEDVINLVDEAENRARDLVSCPANCAELNQLTTPWRAGYAVLLDVERVTEAEESSAFWVAQAQARSNDVDYGPPGDPQPGEPGWQNGAPPEPVVPGYYVGAAVQVRWWCAMDPWDVPPPERDPEDPTPDGGGSTYTPPDEPPPDEEPSPRGPRIGEFEPTSSGGCMKRDKDGNLVPDEGDGDQPASCCYKSGKGRDTHCNNTGCWRPGYTCVPSEDGEECECAPPGQAGQRYFREWFDDAPDSGGDSDKSTPPRDLEWEEELDREGGGEGSERRSQLVAVNHGAALHPVVESRPQSMAQASMMPRLTSISTTTGLLARRGGPEEDAGGSRVHRGKGEVSPPTATLLRDDSM